MCDSGLCPLCCAVQDAWGRETGHSCRTERLSKYRFLSVINSMFGLKSLKITLLKSRSVVEYSSHTGGICPYIQSISPCNRSTGALFIVPIFIYFGARRCKAESDHLRITDPPKLGWVGRVGRVGPGCGVYPFSLPFWVDRSGNFDQKPSETV